MSNPNFNSNFNLFPISCPVGSIIAFAGKIGNSSDSNEPFTTQPIEAFGWMVCDGSALNASQYPELYVVLGNLYGGSGNTFNLPDLRGQFLRGIGEDNASTENRTAAPNGEVNGVGSTQTDALQTHVHTYDEPAGAAPGDSGPAFAAIKPDVLTGIPTNEPSQPTVKVSQFESRPTNVFVNYLIKFTYQLPRGFTGPNTESES
ncbi:tail fiber protein [Flavobacterium aquidurense]|uniref:Putative rhizosphere induced protein RhiB n=1 Tax=Flavobacterium aquidurense TaxID=362413 RepID=A0A0Q0Y1I2_9FLAO|nr:tail fiber protein [Flavobacterium aquidurense]KQB42577.1 putative rhizosphere induced protein RhiB [Flavobacterium aquidurense]